MDTVICVGTQGPDCGEGGRDNDRNAEIYPRRQAEALSERKCRISPHRPNTQDKNREGVERVTSPIYEIGMRTQETQQPVRENKWNADHKSNQGKKSDHHPGETHRVALFLFQTFSWCNRLRTQVNWQRASPGAIQHQENHNQRKTESRCPKSRYEIRENSLEYHSGPHKLTRDGLANYTTLPDRTLYPRKSERYHRDQDDRRRHQRQKKREIAPFPSRDKAEIIASRTC